MQLCGNSFGQQLLVATLRRSFREPLCRTPLESTFREPLWENQPDHFWGAAFGSRFAELVWRVLLVNRFACLGRSFRPAVGETPFSVLCIKKIDSGRNCGKLGGFAAAVTDSCGKLSGATFTIFGVSFHNKNFKEQFSLATFGLSGASLKARLVLKGCSFGAISLDSRHLVATLRRSFREPLCRMALGSHFGADSQP